MKTKNSILLCFAIVICHLSIAQKGKNYAQFDRRKFHFGFTLGANTSDLRYKFMPGVYYADTIVNVSIEKVPGFNMGIVSSWDIHETFHIRFVPCFSFQERRFTYKSLVNSELRTESFRLESTYLDFPVMMKLRTKRINNFAAYGLVGAQYSLDLASQHDTPFNPGDRLMKLKRHDFATQFGGGFDFFMAYYKFAIEIKISNGFKDLYIDEDSFFNSPINSLKSKVWWFSVTFEG